MKRFPLQARWLTDTKLKYKNILTQKIPRGSLYDKKFNRKIWDVYITKIIEEITKPCSY